VPTGPRVHAVMNTRTSLWIRGSTLCSRCADLRGNLGTVNQDLPVEADCKGRRPRPSLCNQILRDPQCHPRGGRGERQRSRPPPSVAPAESPRTGAPRPPPRPWFLQNNGLRTPKTVFERGGDSKFRPEGWGVESLRGTIETDEPKPRIRCEALNCRSLLRV
jgi:hypothetical protein